MKNNARKIAPINDYRKRSAARAPGHLADFELAAFENKSCFTELFIAVAVVN